VLSHSRVHHLSLLLELSLLAHGVQVQLWHLDQFHLLKHFTLLPTQLHLVIQIIKAGGRVAINGVLAQRQVLPIIQLESETSMAMHGLPLRISILWLAEILLVQRYTVQSIMTIRNIGALKRLCLLDTCSALTTTADFINVIRIVHTILPV